MCFILYFQEFLNTALNSRPNSSHIVDDVMFLQRADMGAREGRNGFTRVPIMGFES